ncbi:MAG: hypothetical protein HGA65_04505 [Oscillochloris sp.]|nr:hypothetical protein [Oscillochloris sp.]
MSRSHRWLRMLGLLLVLMLALGIGLAPVTAQRPTAAQTGQATYPFAEHTAITKAIDYLRTQQLTSGGIDSFSYGADPGGTSRLLLALNMVGYPPEAFVNAGRSLLSYLEGEVVGYVYANDTPGTQNLLPARAGLVLSAVAAGGGDPHDVGGVDLVAALNAVYSKSNGTYSTSASESYSSGAASNINQSFAIIGLVAAGQPIPALATQWLLDQQDSAGSWSSSGDVTGYVLVALLGSGNLAPTDAAIQQAVSFYRATQTASTALWGDASGSEPANSTGWALTALSSAGYLPPTASWATGGTNPRTALLGLQTATGAIGSSYVNAYSTIEALYGLSDQPLFFTPPLRAERALAYIASLQNADGGWPSFGSASSPGETIDNLLAFVAAGYSPSAVESSGGKTPLDYLASVAATYTRDDSNLIFPSQTGKLMVGIVAAGGDPSDFGAPTALNLVEDLESTLHATGAYSTTATRSYTSGAASASTQSFAMLGLAAVGRSIPQAAITYLDGLQGTDGGWGDPDTTGLALQALIAAGVAPSAQVIVDGVAYLQNSQAAGGGWESYGTPNANSIAYAIQGLLAAGVDLSASSWLKNGRSPLGTLASYQKPDGPFVYSWEGSYGPGADNLYATQQALPALLRATYPYTATAAGDLQTKYTPLNRGPDPDRLVAGSPSVTFNLDGTMTLSAPFGSDLNGDATATLEWAIESGQAQAASFQTLNATRGTGSYQATLDLNALSLASGEKLVLRATFSDAGDGVQAGETISATPVALTVEAAPYRQYLPVVAR